MVGITGQRPLGRVTGCRRQLGDQPPQSGGDQRGVRVDPGQVGGTVTENRV
ncbi:Uncharacterised protein [Mycobacterium tuberculosis]|nr:Uncharacterised protein [Mycobacterium tuberculosis]